MTDEQQIERIGQLVNATARHLIEVEGLPPKLVLASIHAEAMTMIATSFGGAVAAECATRASGRVAGLPSLFEAIPAAGRA